MIVEVLSKSAEDYDRKTKLTHCRTLSSLTDYVLVSQDACRVEHDARQPDGGWAVSYLDGLEATLLLGSIGCELKLSDIYRKVRLSPRLAPRRFIGWWRASMPHLEVFERAIEHWRKQGIPLLPGASETEIVETFALFSQRPSADVVRLYSLTGGFGGHMDDQDWSLWTLDQIRKEERNANSRLIRFADFLCCSHYHCLRFEDAERSSVYIDYDFIGRGRRDDYVNLRAGSLAEFFERYLEDPFELIAW